MAIPPQLPQPSSRPHWPGGRTPGLTARERIGLAVLAVERARRGTLARVRRSALMRWRHRAPVADDLLLAPPVLRPHDPSFAEEVAAGSFGLAGAAVDLKNASPFAITPPSPAWARELHGFGWLRHLDAARTREIEAMARDLVRDWIYRTHGRTTPAWSPDIVGRRIVSWLSHTGLLLDGAERRPYAILMNSLEDQVSYLSASWRNAPAGYPRLLALVGLVQAGLCIADHERQLAPATRHLADELERQILPDGGHVSRNPAVLVELLLDLLPLRQCFAARGIKPDKAMLAAIGRIAPMLRHLRLGDGSIARFNGMGATERDMLATVLAYDDGAAALAGPALPSGYVRLQRGASVVLVDAAPPPPLELSAHACAGCLSFELSAGEEALFVNGGAPGPAHAKSGAAARATASHNTLTLNGQSSSKPMREAGPEHRFGPPPIRHPDHVACEVKEADGGIVLEAAHDGYRDRYGLAHMRTLVLDATGARLDGVDRLDAVKGVLRFPWDVPFAVHFHVHRDVEARLGPADATADLILPSGERWRLSASGAALSIEESTHFAEVGGPLRAQQVVLRAVCCGLAQVRWSLERLEAGRPHVREDYGGDGVAEQLAEASAAVAAESMGL